MYTQECISCLCLEAFLVKNVRVEDAQAQIQLWSEAKLLLTWIFFHLYVIGVSFPHLLGDNLKIITRTLGLFMGLSACSALCALKQTMSLLLITLRPYIKTVCGMGLNIWLASRTVPCNFSIIINPIIINKCSCALSPEAGGAAAEEQAPSLGGLMQKAKPRSEYWSQGVSKQGHWFLLPVFGSPRGGKGSSSLRNKPFCPLLREFCYFLVMPGRWEMCFSRKLLLFKINSSLIFTADNLPRALDLKWRGKSHCLLAFLFLHIIPLLNAPQHLFF